MNLLLPEEKSLKIIDKVLNSGLEYNYDPQKHKIAILPAPQALNVKDEELVYFRLPITLPPPSLPIKYPPEKPIKYIILMIQSGQCALGYFEGRKNIDHKVFRSYMVRKKQGKSQIKYLKTKGKSRAGSRVRLASTLEFFENINERLQEYFKDYEIDLIAMSCSKTLIPYFFNSKVETPFDKKDERIFKIPKHIPLPSYEELIDMQKFLFQGEFVFEEKQRPFVNSLLELKKS